MAYILDTRRTNNKHFVVNTAVPAERISSEIDVGFKQGVYIGTGATIYNLPQTRAAAAGYVLQDDGTGNTIWAPAPPAGDDELKRITDTGTIYTLGMFKAVDIVSDTYNIVQLPSAAGIGGTKYFIARSSDNNSLKLVAQVGELVDEKTFIAYKRKYYRVTVMSNGINQWYVI